MHNTKTRFNSQRLKKINPKVGSYQLRNALYDRAQSISNTSKSMAEAKSLRQEDNPEQRTDLYCYLKPENTIEYRAAKYIEELEEQLLNNNKTYPDQVLITDPNVLLVLLKAGIKLRPATWNQSDTLRSGHLHLSDNGNVFHQYTPDTVGVSTSPAIAGAKQCIQHFGNVFQIVRS